MNIIYLKSILGKISPFVMDILVNNTKIKQIIKNCLRFIFNSKKKTD